MSDLRAALSRLIEAGEPFARATKAFDDMVEGARLRVANNDDGPDTLYAQTLDCEGEARWNVTITEPSWRALSAAIQSAKEAMG